MLNKGTVKTALVVAAGVIAAGWILANVPALAGRKVL